MIDFKMGKAKEKFYKVCYNFLALLFLTLFIFPPSWAQPDLTTEPQVFRSDNLYQWGSIGSFHGLPSEKINAIAQTRDGLIWFGTERGLAKFDGRRVQAITSQNLSILRILALKVASDGILWIATESGAFRLQDEAFIPLEETRNSSINSIYPAENGRTIYFSGDKGSVFEAEPDGAKSFQVIKILEEDLEIKDISRIDNDLIVGTHKRGILGIRGGMPFEVPTKPRLQFINSFAKDSRGALWLGAQAVNENSGLYRSKNAYEFEKIDAAVGSVTSLSFDGNGNLWVGTKDRGAFQFRDDRQTQRFTFENTAGGLRSNEILSTFVDRENVIWFGTAKGVCRFDPASPIYEKLSEDIQSNFVRTLYRARSGHLLAGTNRGLFAKTADNIWQEVPGFNSTAVYAISEDEFGRLQIAAANGFYYGLDLGTGIKTKYADESDKQLSDKESIRSIEKFKGDTYLAFFGRGLAKFTADQIDFVQENEYLTQIISLYSEGDTTLWIGTADAGVFKFDGKQVSRITELALLENFAIWSIDGTLEKGIWLGTEDGLYLFRNGELKKILPDKDVRSVKVFVDPNGSIETVWCATSNGSIQISPNQYFGHIFSRIDVELGFSSQSAFAILASGGEKKVESIHVGTNRGIANYNIPSIRPLVIASRILSKRLHSANELKGGIDLEYPQNSLSIEVAGLSSRTFPEQFQYSFLLKDSKGGLINKKLSNDSQFLMENLSAGHYSVEIVAYDKNLTSSDALVFSFSIARAPFPWTTLALTVLLSFVIIALIWAIFSQRRISRTSTELEFANKELNAARLDLANEAERERRRISRDLHDQTLADLRHLLLLTDKLPLDEESSEKASVFRLEIENVSNEIRNICEDLSPSVLENIGFTASLEWALVNAVRDSDQFISSEFVCEDKADNQLKLSPHVQIQIFRIVQEVLSNIIQHSEATSIKLTVRNSSDMTFSLTIEDNGVTFDIESPDIKKGRGLTNIQARANLIEALTSWTVNDAGENIFTLDKK